MVSVRTVVAALGTAVALLGLDVDAARGHAFEVEFRPAQGARLDQPVEEVLLQLTEAVVEEQTTLEVRLLSGGAVSVAPLRFEAEGRVVRAVLLDPPEAGVHVVAWHVVSAVDGHETAGEFAFAVGETDEALPADAQGQGTSSPVHAATTLLVLVGMSLGAGGLLVLQFLPVQTAQRVTAWRIIRGGLVAAVTGTAGHLMLGGPTGSNAGTLLESLTSLPLPAAAATALTVLALVAAWRRMAAWPALVTVGAAAVAWSARSHAATYAGLLGAAVDFLHLTAAGLWVGSLVVVAAILRRGEHCAAACGAQRRQLVAGYARVALPLVGVVLATGVVSATQLLDRVADLATSGYGRLLVAKLALVVAVLGLAVLARTRALPAGRMGLLRRVTGTEATALIGVLTLTAVLTNTGPPAGRLSADLLLGPPPMAGPVSHAAGMVGELTISVAAGGEQLQTQVFLPAGNIDGVDIDASAQLPDGRGIDLLPRPCGAGCFTQHLQLPDGVTRVRVDVTAPHLQGGRFEALLAWPPPASDPELLREVVARMRQVPHLEAVERVSSGPDSLAETRYELSGEEFISLVPYGAGEAVDVRRVPGEERAIEFAMPAARMWFTLWLDEHGRVREQRFVNPGHEIHYRLSYPKGKG